MKQVIAIAVVTAALAAGAENARADEGGWHVGESIIFGEVSDEAARYFGDSAFGFRLVAGRRVDRWSLEGHLEAMFLSGTGSEYQSYGAFNYGVDARYLFPLSPSLTGYLRGGLSKTTANGDSSWNRPAIDIVRPDDTYRGRSAEAGLGIQVNGKVRAAGLLYWPLFFAKWGPKVSASAWVDVSRRFTRLHNPYGPTIDMSARIWSIGFSIGGDY